MPNIRTETPKRTKISNRHLLVIKAYMAAIQAMAGLPGDYRTPDNLA
jgi:hypothetical protein